jgi:predicted RNA-binding protein with PIN domain
MPYIIDGHNLIPKIPGISLADLDDEQELLLILGKFASQRRTRIEVYFDQAPVSWDRSQSFGLVKAHFVNRGSTADNAIKNQLSRLGNSARNWTVVSSDREILAEARSFHCSVLKSSEFARMLQKDQPVQPSAGEKEDQPDIPPGDIDYWLDQFGND